MPTDLAPTPVAKSVRTSFTMILKDLEAIPAEAYERNFGGVSRTISDFIYEVTLVNDHIGHYMRGEEAFPWPEGGWIKAPDSLRGKEATLAAFKISAEKTMSTADSFTQEELEAPLTTDDGETTRAERCRFIVIHNWYHMGQLNYIQSLLGDGEMHWG